MANELQRNAVLRVGGKIAGSFKTAVSGVAGATEKLKVSTAKLKASQRGVGAELRAAEKAARSLGAKGSTALRRLEDQQGDLKRTQKAVNSELAKAEREAVRLGQRGTAETKRLRAEARRLEAEERDVAEQIKRVRVEAERLGVEGSKDVRRLREEHEKLGNTLDRQRRKFQRLQSFSKLDVGARLGRSFSDLGRSATVGLGAATAAATGAGFAMFRLGQRTAEYGDKLAKTSAKLGLGVGGLQELRFAAERSGVETKALDVAVQRMVRRLADAKVKPKGPLSKALRQVGLDVNALSGLSPDKQLEAIADAMGGLDSQAQKVSLAFKLFDTEGVNLVNLLKDGAGPVRQLRQEFRDLGVALSAEDAAAAETFNDRLLEAQLTAKGAFQVLGAETLPKLTESFEAFRDKMKSTDLRATAQKIAEAFGKMVDAAIEHGPKIIDLGVKMTTAFVEAIPTIERVAKKIMSVGRWAADTAGGAENLALAVAGIGAAKVLAPLGSVVKVGADIVGWMVKSSGLAGPLKSAITNPWVAGTAAAGAFGFATGKVLDNLIGKAFDLKEGLVSAHLASKAGESDRFNDFVEGVGELVGSDTLIQAARGNRARNQVEGEIRAGITNRSTANTVNDNRRITFNVQGADDPEATARAVERQLQQSMQAGGLASHG